MQPEKNSQVVEDIDDDLEEDGDPSDWMLNLQPIGTVASPVLKTVLSTIEKDKAKQKKNKQKQKKTKRSTPRNSKRSKTKKKSSSRQYDGTRDDDTHGATTPIARKRRL
mmetsp:Transcript_1261/g.3868  ORF Transcript_1261/g.3868 Transcript_1261/m.3868 type:complete len:109 (+) Transcript_1261:594-920(+)